MGEHGRMASEPGTAKIDPDQHRIRPGHDLDLEELSTRSTAGFSGDKDDAAEILVELNARLADLQEMLYAESKHKVLVVLQGMDTSGKDGTIKHVFHTVNPAGVRVADFKKPTEVELAHDYLWRVHEQTPKSGRMVIFNRSHYEDVLVVRVHDLVPKGVWERRYEHIRDFEQMLVDEGTVVIKLFLHISREEQKERLEARLADPGKRWKFALGDLDERKLWDDYRRAYEDAISETSTEDAPWYVVPADRKWYRNLLVSRILIDRLERLDMSYPEPVDDLDGVTVPD